MNLISYIDPGSGSFLLQALLAGVFGALYALKSFWGNLFSRRKPATEEQIARD